MMRWLWTVGWVVVLAAVLAVCRPAAGSLSVACWWTIGAVFGLGVAAAAFLRYVRTKSPRRFLKMRAWWRRVMLSPENPSLPGRVFLLAVEAFCGGLGLALLACARSYLPSGVLPGAAALLAVYLVWMFATRGRQEKLDRERNARAWAEVGRILQDPGEAYTVLQALPAADCTELVALGFPARRIFAEKKRLALNPSVLSLPADGYTRTLLARAEPSGMYEILHRAAAAPRQTRPGIGAEGWVLPDTMPLLASVQNALEICVCQAALWLESARADDALSLLRDVARAVTAVFPRVGMEKTLAVFAEKLNLDAGARAGLETLRAELAAARA